MDEFALSDFRKIKIVTIGGGHGMSAVLRGLKQLNENITAVVTVADNGGSSGALRRDVGVLPPGDIRSCLAALSDDEEFMTQVLQYRFAETAGVGSHNLGNLLLTALANITGSFEEAIHELAKILAIHGRVTPSTLADVNLVAKVQTFADGKTAEEIVYGESEITGKHGKILSCWLEPENASANPEAIRAILNADLVLLGPGSLYTSILPNLMVSGIISALEASAARKVYIANLTSQPGETDDLGVTDHVKIMQKYLGNTRLDGVLCNNFHERKLADNVSWCKIPHGKNYDYKVYCGNLVDEEHVWRHDPQKLAMLISQVYGDLIKLSQKR